MEGLIEAVSPHVLRDYVLVADGWRGAMVSPRGEMSWMCFPSWSDPAVFGGLLGGGGGYRVWPADRHVHGGYYEDRSLVWRQRWVTQAGMFEVRDALVYPGARNRVVILRRLLGIDGTVRARAALELATDYGRAAALPWRREGECWVSDRHALRARWSGAPEARGIDGQAGLAAEFTLEAGENHDLVLEVSTDAISEAVPDPDELWRNTETAWRKAVPTCVDVQAGDDVRRAFSVLRGLTAPNGATVAAATTALPERAEGGRNYDYRYAWIRDICYIGQAGAAVDGAEVVLDDAVRWVTERILSDGAKTLPAYDVAGTVVPDTSHLGLPGYPGGSDVVGNSAGTQFQLDLFGEALLLFARASSADRLDMDGWRAAEAAIGAIAERHGEKDAGIWEIDPELWTHSRLICVAGLRAIAEQSVTPSVGTDALTLADRLLTQADRFCLHRSGRWQRSPQDDRVDASLLLADIRHALPAGDPRSIATRVTIEADLSQEGYLYRFPGSAPLGDEEGAFLVCNFWMALAKLRAGELTDAAQWFERTRASCGSSGLFSEEYDVAQRQLRGNLPQAFVHALLIESAAELSRV